MPGYLRRRARSLRSERAELDELSSGAVRCPPDVDQACVVRAGVGCLNSFFASISGASAEVRLPSGEAAAWSRRDLGLCRLGLSVDVGHYKSPSSGREARASLTPS